jgi:sarcosine/dimethylglycine N-methyltransferase
MLRRYDPMRDGGEQAIYFYSRHPISAEIILSKLRTSRGNLDKLRPEELYPHDQDHYGSLDANDVLAVATGMGDGTHVADFCAGLGGPARYFAHRYGAIVTGIELTPARVKGATELTRLVGLQELVRIVEGNVMAVPLEDKSVDVVISQEALLHIPDRRRAIAEAFRILKHRSRLAFTDWVAHEPLAAADVDLLWEGQAVQALESPESYRQLLRDVGFRILSSEQLTAGWAVLLEARLAMYRKLRKEAEAAGTSSGHDAFYKSYVRLVDLMRGHVLGGVRVVAEKD